MNKYTFVLFLLLISLLNTHAQSCLPEGIAFNTQAQIDSFQVNYPGCTEIEGDVAIWFYDVNDITNLNGLNVLTHIGGSLWIGNNNYLSNLTGLDSLNSIGGSLYIGFHYEGATYESYLTSLTGLENLTSIGGELSIAYNNNLTSLAGLENLASIGTNLEIKYNDVLTSLNALENLEADFIYHLKIFNNPFLSDCEVQSVCNFLDSLCGPVDIYNNATGCDSPREVADNCGITLPCLPFGNYYLLSQDNIDDFQSDFPGCTELEGNVTIEGSDITNLNGINNLSSIGGTLEIQGSSLTDLSGLEGLTSIGSSFVIQNNLALPDLSGLQGIASIGGSLIISYNDLGTLWGLASLTTVGEDLVIGHEQNLITLTGLESLSFIGGNLSVYTTSHLANLTGLANLSTIGGSLYIESNQQILNLTGLEGLTSVGKHVGIRYNYHLISLLGLDNLTSIGGDLSIGMNYGGNPVLVNITALEGLNSIGGGLMINHNDVLNSLTGLDNINAGSIIGLTICNNSSLPACEVQSVCDYLASPNGIIEIHDNATGCNSQEEVQAACEVGVGESSVISRQSSVSIYPNPSTTSITLTLPSTSPVNNTTLSIYNVNLQQLISCRITEPITVLDIRSLSGGVYFVKIADDRTVEVGKFVKQ
jgi:hypothetical protein